MKKNETAITILDPEEKILSILEKNPENLRDPIRYVFFSSIGNETKDAIAHRFNIDTRTLYRWIDRWDSNGDLESANRIVTQLQNSVFSVEIHKVYAKRIKVLERMTEIALEGAEMPAIHAARFLEETLYSKMITVVGDPATSKGYLDRANGFDPDNV